MAHPSAPAPRSSPLALTVLALLHYQPLHPYGIQRLIKQWGKDQVVNVEQRTSLYRTIERLLAAGLIAGRETGRATRYPERAEVRGGRAQRLAGTLAALDESTAAEAGRGLPRIAMLENEYQRAVLAAEARWVTETVSQLRSGQLTWSPDELLAFASRE